MDRNPFIGRANKSMEETLSTNERTIFASYRLIGAILFFGGGGYLLDRWLLTSPWLLLSGLVAGLVIGFSGLLRFVRRG